MPTRVGVIATRIGARYRALPADVRERFETGLASAKATLETAVQLPDELRDDLMSLAYEVVLAVVGDSMGKVRLALAEHCPELYIHFHELLDRRRAA